MAYKMAQEPSLGLLLSLIACILSPCFVRNPPLRLFSLCCSLAMPKCNKSADEASGEVTYTNELGCSLVTDHFLRTLVEDVKVSSLAVVQAPRAATSPEPQEDMVMVFVVFFDVGLPIPSIGLVAGVLRFYGVKLVQLAPNSIERLGVFEWALRSSGVEGSTNLFTYLHDAQCQPKRKKGINVVVNFSSVSLEAKASKLRYLSAPTSRNRWESE